VQQQEIIFGPPGTGKTQTLLSRVDALLSQGLRASEIAYITFTVAARQEAVERARSRYPDATDEEDFQYFRTLHSIAFRELGLSRNSIVKSEIHDFGALISMDFSSTAASSEIGVPTAERTIADRLLAFDHLRRHRCEDPEVAYSRWRRSGDVPWRTVKYFTDAYARWKSNESLFDFTDLLQLARRPLPVRAVIVDEAQDLSLLQWETLDRLAANATLLVVAGDDDQAIFTWAGASVNAFLRRPGDRRVLGRSYRIPKRVHAVATLISSGIRQREPKTFDSRDVTGSVLLVGSFGTVDVTASETSLILIRNHFLADAIEITLRQRGIPYATVVRATAGEPWGEAIVAWERLRSGRAVPVRQVRTALDAISYASVPRATRSLLRAVDQDREITFSDLRAVYGIADVRPWFDALSGIPQGDREYYRRVIQNHGSAALTKPPAVRVSTIHSAKGAEADHVVLITHASRRVQMSYHTDDERRVWYVGATRAKERLTLVGLENPIIMSAAHDALHR
jgi:DNA helicase-2/ATP-dependent DNA helicase PcrA